MPPNPARVKPPQKYRCGETFPWGKVQLEIEIVQSAGDPRLAEGVPLDNELPVAAPEQCSEPHRSGTFIGIARIKSEKRHTGVAADSVAALQYPFAGFDHGTVDLILLPPLPQHGRQPGRPAPRQTPDGGEKIFQPDCFHTFVDHLHPAAEQLRSGMEFIME